MANILTKLRYAEFNSSVGRAILSRVFRPGVTYSIPLGDMRGIRIHYQRGINYHVLLGLYDTRLRRLLRESFLPAFHGDEGGIAIDAGANVGAFSLWFARHVVPNGLTVAFEPNAEAFELVSENVDANSNLNVEVVRAALCDESGQVTFFSGEAHAVSSLNQDHAADGRPGSERKVDVTGWRLDDFLEKRHPDRSVRLIKMDIEGACTMALPGAERTVMKHRPLLFLESHNPDEDRAIGNALQKWDYAAFRTNNEKWISSLEAVHPDPNGVWGTVFAVPKECRDKVEL